MKISQPTGGLAGNEVHIYRFARFILWRFTVYVEVIYSIFATAFLIWNNMTMILQRIPALLYFISYIWLALCEPASKHVIEFNDNNIEQSLARSDFSFIYFYSDGCAYCAQFEPEFEYLSILYNNITDEESTSKVQILKANAIKNKKLSQLFSVNKYPTLKLLNFRTREIIPYKESRNLESLIGFVTEETQVLPNFANFKSNIHFLQSEIELFIKSASKDTLVVFTVPHIQEWENYEYPSHFYQELALSEFKEDMQFVLVDVNKLADNNFLAKYAVSNFPSMIYFTKEGKFKTYHTLLQDTTTNNLLNKNLINEFLGTLSDSSLSNGEWHDNYTDFSAKIFDEKTYSRNKPVRKFGFNNVQGSQSNPELTIDAEYDLLVQNIGL